VLRLSVSAQRPVWSDQSYTPQNVRVSAATVCGSDGGLQGPIRSSRRRRSAIRLLVNFVRVVASFFSRLLFYAFAAQICAGGIMFSHLYVICLWLCLSAGLLHLSSSAMTIHFRRPVVCSCGTMWTSGKRAVFVVTYTLFKSILVWVYNTTQKF